MKISSRNAGISNSALKMIAAITMLTDHIGAVILEPILLQGKNNGALEYATLLNELNSFFRLVIGRAAFPIFCFFLVEGFHQTSNRWRYILRMIFFAFVSEFAFDLSLSDVILEGSYQNVMFTMAIGLMVMNLSERWEKRKQNTVVIVAGHLLILGMGMALADWLRTDYGGYGVLCIAVLYHFRKERNTQLIAATAAFWLGDALINHSMNELMAVLGIRAVAYYNGNKGRPLKYFFYVFYPAHFLVLYGIRRLMLG